MNRLETLCIVSSLGLGGAIGFAAADWRGTQRTIREGAPLRVNAPVALSARIGGQAAQERSALPDGGELEKILEDKLPSRRRVELDRFCDRMDAAGARRAVESLSAREDSQVQELRRQLLERWAELKPEAAAAFAKDKMPSFLNGVLAVWASRDRDGAKTFVAAIKDRDQLLKILPPFTRMLAEGDFEDALLFATALPADEYHNSIQLAFRQAAEKNPAATAARALALPEGDARGSAIRAAVDVWLKVSPQAAMAWVMQRPDTPLNLGWDLIRGAISSWAISDPAGASRFVQNLPSGQQRDDSIMSVAQSWSYRDRGSAVQWVQSLPADKAKAEALGSVLAGWANEDPAAAAAFLARQPAGANSDEMLAEIGENWAKRDPAGALTWVAGQRNEAVEKKVAREAFGTMTGDNPAAAVAALASVRGAEAREEAITAIAKSWSHRDAAEAARWVLELPPLDANLEVLQRVIWSGAGREPVAMARWLGTIKSHPQRDLAIEAFASAAQHHDPAVAAEWAHTLSDTKKRKSLVQEIIRNYANHDALAAREWVLGQTFDPAERTALLGEIAEAEQRK